MTMFAMACGSGALIIILSTFNGFENLSTSLQESFQPDLTITAKKNKDFSVSDELITKLERLQNIAAISKVYEDKVYLKYMKKDALATMKGVDANFFQTNEVKDYMVAGDTLLENAEYSFALLGMGLAQKLNINLNNQFEQIEVYSPKVEVGGATMIDNFERSFVTPGGVYSVYQEYDDKYVLVPLSFMHYLKSADEHEVTSLELKLKEAKTKSTQVEVAAIMGDNYKVKTKLELNETFYRISQIEKLITFFILVFILVILSFNFIGSLTMHIIEKEEDIKMLHYLGLKANQIFKLYMIYGIMQGMLGGFIGLCIGLTICAIQHYFGIINLPGSGTFVVQAYPVTIYWLDVIFILIILFLVSASASIFPALRAKKRLVEVQND